MRLLEQTSCLPNHTYAQIMALFFDLPTTAEFSFAKCLIDPSSLSKNNRAVLLATQHRQRLRLTLKTCKRTEVTARDWLAVYHAVQDYLPHLLWIKENSESDALISAQAFSFAWTPTIFHSKLKKQKRAHNDSIYYELAFCLLTLGLTMFNMANRTVVGLSDYEHQRFTSDVDRKRLDNDLNNAADMLCRASGTLRYIAEAVIPDWNQLSGQESSARPLDVSEETTLALADIAMASAERLAIRRLLSRAVYDATLTPGPPLPRSHPSPSLLAKLQLNVCSLFTSASSLTAPSSNTKFLKDFQPELQPYLQRYIQDGLLFSNALAYKWLGVDLGEAGKEVGESIAWLKLAQSNLDKLAGGNKLTLGKKASAKKESKSRLMLESESIAGFLTAYQGVNNRITYQPIPSSSVLLSRVPGGRSALTPKPYRLPDAAMVGESSLLSVDMANLNLGDDDSDQSEGEMPSGNVGSRDKASNYALATEYF